MTDRSTPLDRFVGGAIRRRGLVLLVVAGVAVLSAFNLPHLLIDAVPDITGVQVVINTQAPGYTPEEIEQRITVPLEAVLGGLPGVDLQRSLSKYELSQITVLFHDDVDPYFARQLVGERLQQVRGELPAGVEPRLGPVATGLGEIYWYTLEDRRSDRSGSREALREVRTLQDFVVRPRLLRVPGVAEVNTIGGFEQQYYVLPDPARLVSFGVTFADVADALERANGSASAGYVEDRGAQWLVRVPGQFSGPAEVADAVVAWRERVPIRVRDVAEVRVGERLRTGSGTVNGREAVVGTAVMRVGENSRVVARAVASELARIQSALPPGVRIVTLYDRTVLVERTIRTVAKNLVEGAVLVIAVLLVALGNLRAALITAAVIPLAMLLTVAGLVEGGVSGNLMSLGALDFGLIVDGAVIIVDNCIRRLSAAGSLSGDARDALIARATGEVLRPAMFGVAVIAVVYVPVLALGGVEGKMFRPMAITVVLALAAALLLAVTFVPAAVAAWVAPRTTAPRAHRFAGLRARLRRAFAWTQAHPTPVIGIAATLVIAAGALATHFGREFIPSLDEGDVTVQAWRPTGIALSQATTMQQDLERALMKVPEVAHVFARLGTDEQAADPGSPSVADTFVMLKPRDRWADPQRPKAALVADLERAARSVPGSTYELTQPIQERFNDLIAGTRSALAIKVYGTDLETLKATAERMRDVIAQVPGAADVRVEPVLGLPLLSIEQLPDRMASYGVRAEALRDAVATAVGGRVAGQIVQGDRRFPIVIRLPEDLRTRQRALARLPIPVETRSATAAGSAEATGGFVPLELVARLRVIDTPNQINRENGQRRVVVSANPRGRDLGSFAADVERAVNGVPLPSGYWVASGGTVEQLRSATRRLAVAAPAALLLIAGLLYLAFGTVRDAAVVFAGVPLALTGGVAALAITGTPLSITAAVGFIAVSGVAVLNGLVLVEFIHQRLADGEALGQAVEDAVVARMRPVAMTALVASLGFVPMALNTGTGSEVQRPLAIVVIGGIVSSTLLTLIVLPALYRTLAWTRR